jgi:hypothetical protein
VDPLDLDAIRDDPEGREFGRRHAPLIRCDSVTGTQVRQRPDGTVEVRYGDGEVDVIE